MQQAPCPVTQRPWPWSNWHSDEYMSAQPDRLSFACQLFTGRFYCLYADLGSVVHLRDVAAKASWAVSILYKRDSHVGHASNSLKNKAEVWVCRDSAGSPTDDGCIIHMALTKLKHPPSLPHTPMWRGTCGYHTQTPPPLPPSPPLRTPSTPVWRGTCGYYTQTPILPLLLPVFLLLLLVGGGTAVNICRATSHSFMLHLPAERKFKRRSASLARTPPW